MRKEKIMAYVLKSERHYTNGKTATLYHKCFTLCFHECCDKEEATQFRTKKEAREVLKQLGKSWEIENV